MKLKEVHKDIERYLAEDCYCPNEVYSVDGFGYLLVYADAECNVLSKHLYKGSHIITVATEAEKSPILLNIWVDGDSVLNMERYELTKDNIKNMNDFLEGKIDTLVLSEYDELKKYVSDILSIADAIIY